MVLPKHMRLKGHRCFDYIYKEGTRFYSYSMILRITRAKPKLQAQQISLANRNSIKCAISISNKVSKKSVKRNKLRRLFHQHLAERLSKMNPDKEIWTFISLKPCCMKCSPCDLLKECDKLLSKAGLAK